MSNGQGEQYGELNTLDDAQRWLRILAGGVVTGELDARTASVATKAIQVWTEAHLQAIAEQRMASR